MQKIIDFIKAIIELVITAIVSIVNFVINIPRAISWITEALAILPEKFIAPTIVAVSISIIFFLIGRQK